MSVEAVGKQIRQFRKLKGLTQEKLANISGLSLMSIRRYESGERIPSQSTLIKIAKALNVHLKNFFDSSVWDEFDEKYPNTGLDAKKFDHFNSYLESIGYTVHTSIEGNEGESYSVNLTKDGITTIFTEEEFDNFQLQTKQSVDYQFWLKRQNKK